MFVFVDSYDGSGPDELAQIAAALDLLLHRPSRAGHINTASGYGPREFALAWALHRKKL